MISPLYNGLYINLDRSTARRDAMERQFDRLELSPFYTRFAAIDGTTLNSPRSAIGKGETGCFQSHYRALLSARPRGTFVHILEDDAPVRTRLAGCTDERDRRRLEQRAKVVGFVHASRALRLLCESGACEV